MSASVFISTILHGSHDIPGRTVGIANLTQRVGLWQKAMVLGQGCLSSLTLWDACLTPILRLSRWVLWSRFQIGSQRTADRSGVGKRGSEVGVQNNQMGAI